MTLGDLGGFFAGGIALLLAWFGFHREDRRRPVLSLGFDSGIDGNDYLSDARVPGGGAHYIRMRVANESRKDVATNVEILLMSIVRVQDDSPVSPGGYAFKWSNVAPIDGRPRTQLDLPAGMARHFDFLMMHSPWHLDAYGNQVLAAPGEAVATPANLEIFPLPADQSHRLEAGEYRLELAITAENADTEFKTVTIEFDGKSVLGDEVREHLSVEVS